MTSLGYADVATYIQSGNVVFTAPDADSGKLAGELDEKIAERFGVPGHVVVVTRDELARGDRGRTRIRTSPTPRRCTRSSAART